jgi:hypothetical protein
MPPKKAPPAKGGKKPTAEDEDTDEILQETVALLQSPETPESVRNIMISMCPIDVLLALALEAKSDTLGAEALRVITRRLVIRRAQVLLSIFSQLHLRQFEFSSLSSQNRKTSRV